MRTTSVLSALGRSRPPFFDVEAETRVRVPGQTYRVTFRASGTRDRFAWDFSSDPPLSTVDRASGHDAVVPETKAGAR